MCHKLSEKIYSNEKDEWISYVPNEIWEPNQSHILLGFSDLNMVKVRKLGRG